MADIIFDVTGKINDFLGYACTIIAGFALFFHVIRYSFKSIKERGLGQGLLLSFIFTFEYALGTGVVLGLAFWLPTLTSYITFASVIWAAIYCFLFLYYQKRKQSEGRGLYPMLLHIVILNAGWFSDRWLGMLFYSMPLLFIFHHLVHRVALVTIPASHPDDKTEIKQRRNIFLSYILGLQMPLWNVTTVSACEAEKRVDGAPLFEITPFPGMIRTYSNQVVGISNGINFRVEGPGIVFTQKGDQPFEVIDLRTQNRSSTIRVFSKESIPFFANINITFKISNEKWDRNSNGLFPYSSARVKSVLYLRSKHAQPDGETERWGDHVLATAEEAAREALAERPLIELWDLENLNSSALDDIAKRIKAQIEIPLCAKGVQVISVKASPDFSADKEEITENDRKVLEKIIKQQVAAWSMDRKQERISAQTEAKIHAEHTEQEAHLQAYSSLLTAIAEGLQVTQTRDADRVRNIIILRYVSVLEKLIHQQPYHSKDGERPKSRTVLKFGNFSSSDSQRD